MANTLAWVNAVSSAVASPWITGGTPPSNQIIGSNFCVGVRIQPSFNITVTQLGLWIIANMTGDGLIPIGIWTDGGLLLGSVNVNSATATLNAFNYSSLSSSVSLTASSFYRIALCNPPHWYDQQAYTVTADVVDDHSCFVASATLAFPSSTGNAGQAYGIVNFKYTKP